MPSLIGRPLVTLRGVTRLIINADDFGLTPGVNRAIVELQLAGALSSTTLMATAKYFSAAVHLAFAQPALSVGCHVVLVDGVPCLHPREVPSLLNPEHPLRFRPSSGIFWRDSVRGRIREEEIEAEAVAQIRRIQSSGLTVSHIDSHKHVHLFPPVLRPLLRAARHCGVACVRNPFEPGWSLRVTKGAGVLRRAQVYGLHGLERAWSRSVAEQGMKTTDGTVGVLATGSLNAQVLRSLLEAMPEGTWELVCHPGYRDADLEQANTRLVDSREVERVALLEVVPAMLGNGAMLVDFHQLASELEVAKRPA